MKFSANLGFLWSDRPLMAAISAAQSAGFAAVECHWPYQYPAQKIAEALRETGLPMLSLNTSRGDPTRENGLTAVPGREAEARAAVDQALDYAAAIGARKVHVMAGNAQGPLAHRSFVEGLRYACSAAEVLGLDVLIEPLNRYDAPGYFLNHTDQARRIIQEVGAANLQLMFDCYHVQLLQGDVSHQLRELAPLIGHIQVASVPDRGAPDHGELSYAHVFRLIEDLDLPQPVGAEYKPTGATEATLDWLDGHR